MTDLPDTAAENKPVTPTWRFLIAMIRYRPWLYLSVTLIAVVFCAFPVVIGKILQHFFNALAEPEPSHRDLMRLLAISIGFGVGTIVMRTAVMPLGVGYYFCISALLRKNLLASIQKRPGARALPDSAGEAIARLRGDVDMAANFAYAPLNMFLEVAMGLVALGFMIQVNVFIW